MTKITRATQQILGSTAAGTDVSQFGSKSAGSPTYTKDPATIMALSQFLTGFRAVTTSNAPYIQDMNAAFLAITSQIAYLLQEGVPEYDSSTNYFINSIVKKSGTADLYKSLTDNNLGNALTNGTYWQIVTTTTLGSGAPSTTPATSGLYYIDTLNQVLYYSTGNSTSSDWRTDKYQNASSGANWYSVGLPSTVSTTGAVAWSPSLELFCISALNSGTWVYFTSHNALTWTQQTSQDSAHGKNALYWSSDLSIFVAGITNGNFETSPDGVTWTLHTTATGQNTFGITYAPSLGLLCAVGQNGGVTAGLICTSADQGATWVARTPSTTYWLNSVAWSPTVSGGLFVAVGLKTGTVSTIMTSPDGITWTERNSSYTGLYNVIWISDLNLFVAVGNSAVSAGVIVTSPDGITWTARVTGATQQWHYIAYALETKTITAVSYNGGTLQRAITSKDALNWTIRTTPIDLSWYGIAWSASLGMFLTIANSSNILMAAN